MAEGAVSEYHPGRVLPGSPLLGLYMNEKSIHSASDTVHFFDSLAVAVNPPP